MIPRFVPPIGLAELAAAVTPSGRNAVSLFETEFAATMNQKAAIAFPYGRTALVALLQCLGLSGRNILCPAYTCVVVPNAIVASGNHPVFLDSGRDANARLEDAEALIDEAAGAVIATSIFGNPVDLDALATIARRHPGLPIIQDCAHSFICEWQGRPVHKEGIAAFYGLNVSKTMTSVFGGMITTDDEALGRSLRRRRDEMLTPAGWGKTIGRALYACAVGPAFWPPLFGLTDRLRRAGLFDGLTKYYDEAKIDMPGDYLTSMTQLEARVGRVQARRLTSMIASRRAYDAYYREHLADMPGLAWIDRPDGSSISHVAARVANRDAVRLSAARAGIELGEVIEYSVPEFVAYRRIRRDQREFPVSGVLARTVVNLPTSNRFVESRARQVAEVLRYLLKEAEPPPPLPGC